MGSKKAGKLKGCSSIKKEEAHQEGPPKKIGEAWESIGGGSGITSLYREAEESLLSSFTLVAFSFHNSGYS